MASRTEPASAGRGGSAMSDSKDFGYDGKRVLVVGGATGMGAAAAQTVSALGGEVVVLDYAPVEFPVAEAIKVDLRDRAAIDDRARSGRWSRGRAVLGRGSRRRHTRDHEDQLHRPPSHHREADGRREAAAWFCSVHDLVGRRARLGRAAADVARVPRDARLRVRGRLGAGARGHRQLLRSASRR